MNEVGRGEALCQDGMRSLEPDGGIPRLTTAPRVGSNRSRSMLL